MLKLKVKFYFSGSSSTNSCIAGIASRAEFKNSVVIEEGFFDIDDISPNNNFWMNDKGVHYIYNQYEIAPYSMGPIDVSIPFEELTSIIIPESIAGKYMEKE